jgi:heat shock protein HslJ
MINPKYTHNKRLSPRSTASPQSKASLLSLVVLLALLVGCTSAPPAAGNPLAGTSWQAIEIGDQPVITGSEVTIIFEEGRAVGNTGCNSYGGSYEVGAGNSITFGEIEQTLIACIDPPGLMEQESAFTERLIAANTYNLTGDRLELIADGQTVLVFERD